MTNDALISLPPFLLGWADCRADLLGRLICTKLALPGGMIMFVGSFTPSSHCGS